MNRFYCFISICLFISGSGNAQYYNECAPSTGNDTVILSEGITLFFRVDSFYRDTLRRTRVYSDQKMIGEFNYNPDGSRGESFSWYQDGKKSWIRNLDYNTGHMVDVGWNEAGQMEYYMENPTDSFDAEYERYYPDGSLAIKGFYRDEEVQMVKSYTDTSFVLSNKSGWFSWPRTAQVGLWHYYYSNGKDSATGHFAYTIFQFDSVYSSPDDMYIAIGTTTFSEIKTGTWNYYSPEGKLICREEWDKGNFLRRETF